VGAVGRLLRLQIASDVAASTEPQANGSSSAAVRSALETALFVPCERFDRMPNSHVNRECCTRV